MHTPSVESPPRPPAHRGALRSAAALAASSLLLLILVAAEWGP